MLDDSQKSNARVLVIDDDPLFRNLMVSFLRREFIVSVASDGSEGFYKALEYPPDIAIVDVQMAEWDGLQTLKAFRTHPTLAATKIIMLTSDASKETVIAAIQGGANDYIIKTSFSKTEFLEKVRKHASSDYNQNLNVRSNSIKQTDTPQITVSKQKVENQKAETPAMSTSSVKEQVEGLELDQSEEEQLQGIMEDWD